MTHALHLRHEGWFMEYRGWSAASLIRLQLGWKICQSTKLPGASAPAERLGKRQTGSISCWNVTCAELYILELTWVNLMEAGPSGVCCRMVILICMYCWRWGEKTRSALCSFKVVLLLCYFWCCKATIWGGAVAHSWSSPGMQKRV